MRFKINVEYDEDSKWIYFGGGGGGLCTPVVSYAPRPKLRGDSPCLSSVMVGTVEAAMVRRQVGKRVRLGKAKASSGMLRLQGEEKN